MKNVKLPNSISPLFIIAILFTLTSCADIENVKGCVTGEPSGFFSGLFHGLLLLPIFVISLLSDNVAVYDVNNTGHWYDLGFAIGAGAFSVANINFFRNLIKNFLNPSKEEVE